MHVCVSIWTIIDSDNGLSLGWHQAIIWTNAGILFIGRLEANFSGILIEIYTFSFKKMHLKMPSGKRRTDCVGLNVLTHLPGQNSEKFWILIKISLKFVPKGPNDNNPALV